MKNTQLMQLLQPLHRLYKNVPNFPLRDRFVLFRALLNLEGEVLVGGQLHHDAICEFTITRAILLIRR